MTEPKHVVGLSGGKDSTCLALAPRTEEQEKNVNKEGNVIILPLPDGAELRINYRGPGAHIYDKDDYYVRSLDEAEELFLRAALAYGEQRHPLPGGPEGGNMSLCVVDGGHCSCDPQVGQPCPGVEKLKRALARALAGKPVRNADELLAGCEFHGTGSDS